MKFRTGFVSNSSSTCYILDLRKEAVKEFVSRCGEIDRAMGLGRSTAIATGEEAVQYAVEWNESIGEYEDDDYLTNGLGTWILEWAKRLGKENVVFVRNSDEGSGDYLPGMPGRFSEAAREYH